ncbi:MAG TPA: cation:dicarboxylase symporter family transporter [Vicinamibacterales bacterium]
MQTGPAEQKPSGPSLSRRIAIAVAGGSMLGLFAGDRVAPLNYVGNAYINLLQMTVLPYVTMSIISGLGALDPVQARTLGKRAGVVLALLWSVGLAAVTIFPLMFPTSQDASFFSTTLLQEREPFNFLGLYIPTNPFNALANSIVPGVVLFSIVVGVALIGMPDKGPLLQTLSTAARAVARATSFIIALTPIGMFAIAAVVAGTLSPDELRRLQVYLITYAGIALFLSLWVIPGLVAALTPVPFGALLSRTRDALVMAFMTTSLFAVLPLLTEQAKHLVREYAKGGDSHDAATDVIVPASFNFPHTGKLLSLSFILFAGWYADIRISPSAYPQLLASGFLTMFGSVNAAVPFLLDLMRIPADTFQLFVSSAALNSRFGALVAAVHTLAVAVLGTCAMTGALTFEVRKIARFALITLLLAAGIVGGTRAFMEMVLRQPYTKDAMMAGMTMRSDRGRAVVFGPGNPAPPLPAVTGSILDRVRSRGVVRVGYLTDSLPYAFFNTNQDLVGFDVEMAMQLARDLGVTAEFVLVDRAVFTTGLDPSVCDLLMSGAPVTPDRSLNVLFSASYLDETVAFIVPDHHTTEFAEWESVRALGRLRVAVPPAPYFMQKIRDELKDVDIVPITQLDEMFAPHDPPTDAVVMTAERGSAYTLLHPEFSVVVPKPRMYKVPLAYVIAGRDAPMAGIVNTWIDLKRKDDTIDQLFAHWILGQTSEPRRRRWSIMDDVLGWGR